MGGGGEREQQLLDEELELARLWQDVVSEAGNDSAAQQQEHVDESNKRSRLHPAIYIGVGSLFIVNLAMLLSLPPVLLGKGAPYLPTYSKKMSAMFTQLRQEPSFRKQQMQQNNNNTLRFVDLGSGDGRFVFRAAQEGLFDHCVGYEINPLLYLWSQARRLVSGPRVWSTTSFYCRDIWKVDLRQTNVVAVYGLGPIMGQLGTKLQQELPNGSFVLSNVFDFPGWIPCRPTSSDVASASYSAGTFVYKTPDCWAKTLPVKEDNKDATST